MLLKASIIDVWDVGTFDAALLEALEENQQLIKAYFSTDHAINVEREASDWRTPPIRTNEHEEQFHQFAEKLTGLVEARHIRAWHYTRLSANEVETLKTEGVYVSNLESLRR
jgi:hypothetical protein